jgi:NAD(P)-dependent dehydrogenase (short-subunit alcohol dehydrogenase family)
MDEPKGLKALVTGGASGIGLAIAATFAAEGAVVVVLDQASERPDALPAEIGYVTASVTDDAAVSAAVAAALETLGGVDILVNNAGIGAQGTVEDAPDEEWHRVLDVNVVGIARVSRAALEARQPHGRLVSADEVAHAALYLASPRAGSTTGAEIAVDGGMAGLRLRPRT